MKIGNKEYMQVNERVNEFRTNEKYKGYALKTSILDHHDGFIMIKAFVLDNNDRIVAEGTAYELNEAEGKNTINLTSYIENCETSAVGRALGFLGIGVDSSIASAEEVTNAIKQQKNYESSPEQSQETNKEFDKVFWDGKSPIKKFDHFMVGPIEYITMQNKTTNELFGLATDKSITGPEKWYKFV